MLHFTQRPDKPVRRLLVLPDHEYAFRVRDGAEHVLAQSARDGWTVSIKDDWPRSLGLRRDDR
jgi:hypothetical protein